MRSLTTTLRDQLAHADAAFDAGRLRDALALFEALTERAQERGDAVMQVIARSMLAWCALRRRDLKAAQRLLAEVNHLIDPVQLEATGRYRAVLARVAQEQGQVDEVQAYYAWAADAGLAERVVDACSLLGRLTDGEQRVDWLERGLEAADHHPPLSRSRLALSLGDALEQLHRQDEALSRYRQALEFAEESGRVRAVVAAAWSLGALARRMGEWPDAQSYLERAVAVGESAPECVDLVGLAQADLAMVYEAAGDVVEARRTLLRALKAGEELELAVIWPQRWEQMLADARRLDLR